MTKNILLVEYAAPSIDAVKDALTSPGLDISVVDEGEAAKHLLEEKKFDLLITAAMLPKFHGFNLSLHVANNYPDTKIIIISGIYKGEDTRQKAINEYKANDFIEKPVNKEEFRARVLELLGVTEKDLQAELAHSTVKIPLIDTTKIPTIKKIREEKEKRKLTSEDIFGDLIDKVDEEPRYEISLNGEKPEQKIAKEKEKAEESVETRVPETLKTVTVKPDDVETKKPKKKKPDSLATQKFEIDINSLVKPETKEKNKKKFKKIEDEISRKFEDTLSGLGISNKKPDAGLATQKIDVIREQDLIEQNTEVEKTGDEEFKTQRIELPVEDFQKEKEVGDYEILGLIARGGMAEIYKAKKKGVKGFEKIIALKKILSGYGEDDKYIEMFVDEAKIAAELTHPNIVQIYDLGEKDDFYFIAMEYVLGKDLRLILRKLSELKKLFPEELALYLILKVLSALNYAHSAKDSKGKPLEIVHRDISPPNILVSFDGNIKLTDFGVSKATTKMHQTVSGALKGKLLYMSPEQASSDDNIDFRSDLYSVGIILFELITGKKLFIDSSDLLVLKKVQQGEIIKPSEVKKDINPELEVIILKSLNKNRAKRYKNASDMMKDIETYLMYYYDRVPGPIHISHFLYSIFREEILKDNIDFDLKPLPYEIKRIHKEDQDVLELELDDEKEIPPEQEEPEPETALPEKEEEEKVVAEIVLEDEEEEEEEFKPVIEIDLDNEDKVVEEEAQEKPEKEKAADQKTKRLGIKGLEELGKRKRTLLWVILLTILGIVAVVWIINFL